MAFVVIEIIRAITIVLAYGGAVLGAFCVIDAATRRADAFAAADKKTKGTWVGINIACGVALGFGITAVPMFQPQSLLWLAALIGIMVYLADVRPAVKRITEGGSRW